VRREQREPPQADRASQPVRREQREPPQADRATDDGIELLSTFPFEDALLA